MPNLVIQRRRRRLALALMLVQINYTANRLWIHPVNNLRFEKSEFYGLYQDYREYEDKFFNWYRMSTQQFDELKSWIDGSEKRIPTSESQFLQKSSFASR